MADEKSAVQGAAEHKRRKRYSGRYPKRFEEKYKELDPEKYSGIAEHVIQKGSTPAGMHIPIMVEEILDILKISPGEKGFDATLGYGGHTLAMLEKLGHNGHICATDVDRTESEKTRKRLLEKGYGEDDLSIVNANFAKIKELAPLYGPFDFILADLGISSMQMDDPSRGFSYKADGPLDLRMDPTRGISAARLLEKLSQEELEGMLEENADEPYAKKIAAAIASVPKGSIKRTSDLARLIGRTLNFLPKDKRADEAKRCCARVFQALRIDVNREFEALYDFLSALPDVLAPGGRVAILTFHSGEDRLVKKAFKAGLADGSYQDIAKDVIRPTKEEAVRNPRSRPAKLRWAVKVGEKEQKDG